MHSGGEFAGGGSMSVAIGVAKAVCCGCVFYLFCCYYPHTLREMQNLFGVLFSFLKYKNGKTKVAML